MTKSLPLTLLGGPGKFTGSPLDWLLLSIMLVVIAVVIYRLVEWWRDQTM